MLGVRGVVHELLGVRRELELDDLEATDQQPVRLSDRILLSDSHQQRLPE